MYIDLKIIYFILATLGCIALIYIIITLSNLNKLIKNSNELVIDNGYIEESSYSKKTNNIFSYDEKKLLKIGERIHYILEVIDLKNPNFDIIKDSFIRDKVSSLLSSDLFKNIGNAKIYKEYEFIYNHDSVKRHGIIDLMLEYDDYILTLID